MGKRGEPKALAALPGAPGQAVPGSSCPHVPRPAPQPVVNQADLKVRPRPAVGAQPGQAARCGRAGEAMADEDAATQAGEGAEGAPAKRRLPIKKIVLLGVLPVLALAGVGAVLTVSGLLGGGADEAGGEAMTVAGSRDAHQAVFYDLPQMLVNLNGGGRQSSFLKIQVSLELGSAEAVPEVEAALPRIVDNFQVYLRELRPDELSGTKGLVRLKEELLVRVNRAVEPVTVYDILFKEILVQS